jgi:hypothetical protein
MGVVDVLQRKRQDLLDFEGTSLASRMTIPPQCFSHTHIEYAAKGRGIRERALTDAIRLSLEKYCSVSGTVSGRAEITTSYQIVEVWARRYCRTPEKTLTGVVRSTGRRASAGLARQAPSKE